MNDVSYVPIWLYLYHIGDDLDSWLNRIPLEDGTILTRRRVLIVAPATLRQVCRQLLQRAAGQWYWRAGPGVRRSCLPDSTRLS